MAPSGVNDVIRENMAASARWYASLDGSLESTGSSNAYVITTGSSHAALADIGLLVFRANHTNTTAATLAVDGLAAKALNFNGAALIAGQITSGQVYVVAYNSTGDVYNLANITGTATLGGALTDCTVDGTNAVGFRTIPQNSQSEAYELVLADSGKHILHPSADTSARTFTIPANGSVAFPIGTAVTFVNQASAGVVTIAITTDTMRLAGAGTTGSRSLAPDGLATALKITSTQWVISGVGLT
jgi:hypothetical protein